MAAGCLDCCWADDAPPVDCCDVQLVTNNNFTVMQQAKEEAEDEAWRVEEARRAAIVAEERARLLRGAVHLRDYLPAEDARQIVALMAGAS
jgi:hypothetical protein